MELDNNTKHISSKTVNLNENTNQLNQKLISCVSRTVKQEALDADDVQFEVCTVKSETLSTDYKFESPSPDTYETEVINNLSLVLKSETLDQDSSKVKSEESIFIKEELLHKEGDIKTEERTVQESRVEDEHNLGNQISIHRLPNVVKRFKCNICDRWFVLKTSLQSHLKFHTKPFKCHLCDYSCAHHGSLMTHLRTHSGGQPFKCNICDYTAAQISCLRHHLTTHRGKKPFNCYICYYSCEHKCQLQHHISTHTRQKRYKSKFVIVSVQRKVAERAIKH